MRDWIEIFEEEEGLEGAEVKSARKGHAGGLGVAQGPEDLRFALASALTGVPISFQAEEQAREREGARWRAYEGPSPALTLTPLGQKRPPSRGQLQAKGRWFLRSELETLLKDRFDTPETVLLQEEEDLRHAAQQHPVFLLRPDSTEALTDPIWVFGSEDKLRVQIGEGPSRTMSPSALYASLEGRWVIQLIPKLQGLGQPAFFFRLFTSIANDGLWRLEKAHVHLGASTSADLRFPESKVHCAQAYLYQNRSEEDALGVWNGMLGFSMTVPQHLARQLGGVRQILIDLTVDAEGHLTLIDVLPQHGGENPWLDVEQAQLQGLAKVVKFTSSTRPLPPSIGLLSHATRPNCIPAADTLTAMAAERGLGLFFLPALFLSPGELQEGFVLREGAWVKEKHPLPKRILNQWVPHFPEEVQWLMKESVSLHPIPGDKNTVLRALAQEPSLAPYSLATTSLPNPEALSAFLEARDQLIIKDEHGGRCFDVNRVTKVEGGYELFTDGLERVLSFEALCERFCGRHYVAQEYHRSETPWGRPYDLRLLFMKDPSGQWRTRRWGRVAQIFLFTTSRLRGGYCDEGDRLLDVLFAPSVANRVREDLTRLEAALPAIFEERWGEAFNLALDVGVDADGRIAIYEVDPQPELDTLTLSELGWLFDHLLQKTH